jgi:hypothetical protein
MPHCILGVVEVVLEALEHWSGVKDVRRVLKVVEVML